MVRLALEKLKTQIILLFIVMCSSVWAQTNDLITKFQTRSLQEIGRLANNFTYVQVSQDDIKFLLYHAQNNSTTVLNQNSAETLSDMSKRIIILVHGWTDNGQLAWISQTAKAYFATKNNPNFYIMSIDWQKPASASYPAAVSAAQAVGSLAADILWRLLKQDSKRLRNVHVIGHSLGAHVAGFMGQKIQELSNFSKFDRITGLDAANPLFITKTRDLQLSRDDAEFVDCFHTDISFRGQGRPCGQVDVYFNCHGKFQPGCDGYHLTFNEASSCSHQLAHKYFINSIRNKKFYVAEGCDLMDVFGRSNNQRAKGLDFVFAGEYVRRNAAGTYCVSTVGGNVKECRYIV